ncbi:unnamed protein product [Caenorhabditis nigoni]
MAFLVENQLDFSVKCSEPIEETPTSSQSSEDIDLPAAEIQRITSNEGEISGNLAKNELRIPRKEPEVAPINKNKQSGDYNSSENIDFPTAKRMKLDNLADKMPQEESQDKTVESEKPENAPVAPIAHIRNESAQKFIESNQTDNLADKIPKEEPEPKNMESETSNNVQVAPIAQRAVMERLGRTLICQVCRKRIIKTSGYHRRLHALHHLKLRTWKCTLCDYIFKQSCFGPAHFSSMHPDVPYTSLVETISDEEKRQVDEMEVKCFPSKKISLKRLQNDH